jgi:oligopeptide/dipeptide ABC transporter ATP-binding protein
MTDPHIPPVLRVRDLVVAYPSRDRARPDVRAVDGVSLDIAAGETLGLVGESGCGKSSLANAIVGLVKARSGSILVHSQEVVGANRTELRAMRAQVQMVFQDPATSLNPRMRIGAAIGEPLLVRGLAKGSALRARVLSLLDEVGLRRDQADLLPHQLSGGQRQRVVIARALALRPALLVCDEPVSALDVSVRAQILNLLVALQAGGGMASLFVSHDLAVVRHVCDRVAVMYLGQIVERADATTLYTAPRHPYTQALLAAVPEPDPVLQRSRSHAKSTGEIPSPANPPSGCRFHTRCPIAQPQCAALAPLLRRVGDTEIACHLA